MGEARHHRGHGGEGEAREDEGVEEKEPEALDEDADLSLGSAEHRFDVATGGVEQVPREREEREYTEREREKPN